MIIEQRPSPNRRARPPGTVVSLLVLHADASRDVGGTIDYCRDPASQVSYHAIVGRTGRLFALVPTAFAAWSCDPSEYAGVSVLRDSPALRKKYGRPVPCLNHASVSLCLSNRNDGFEAYPDAQLTAAALWAAWAMEQHPRITPDRITTHAIVAWPQGRKTDPLGLDLADFRARVRSLL